MVDGMELKVKKETWLATPSLATLQRKLDRVLYPLSTKVPTKNNLITQNKILGIKFKGKTTKMEYLITFKTLGCYINRSGPVKTRNLLRSNTKPVKTKSCRVEIANSTEHHICVAYHMVCVAYMT